MDAQMTVREAYLRAASFFRQSGIAQDPARVSEWLVLSLLGWTRTDFFLRWDEPFPEHRLDEWQLMLQRKAEGEPVQYIIGEQQFMGLDFAVSPDVLIPRPETEVLVEHMMRLGQAYAEKKGIERPYPMKVADIGTGSGAIPVSMAVHHPDWSFVAVDLSAGALTKARHNAKRHGVDERITFMQGDLLLPLEPMAASIDMLISNPPYIPTEEMASLAQEVGGHEPILALDGGDDGLTCYKAMVRQMKEMGFFPELLGFEVGIGQAESVINLLDAGMKWSVLEAIPDLTGRMRHVIAVK